MPIRPIDVRRKEFKNSFRGYDANQVDDFLDAVADEFERSHTENSRMSEELSSLRARLQQFEELEGSIRAALVHAEQAANDLRRSASREAEDLRLSAQREADLTIREAQSRSHQMLAESSARVERIQDSFEALQEAKRTFANDFRHLLKTYTEVMDQADVASAREVEATLRGRLDSESIAIAREAASYEETAAQAGPEPAPSTGDAEASLTTDAAPEEPFGEAGVEQETAYLEQETAYLDRETAYLEEEPASVEPESVEPESVEPESVEPESVEPESVEPEIYPSTAPSEEDTTVYEERPETEEPAAEEPATEEPVAEEPATEEPAGTFAGEAPPEQGADREDSGLAERPALAEESRSEDFFDRSEESAPEEGRGTSRIFRASRFLRRRE